MIEYSETGGLRWGPTTQGSVIGSFMNATWPMAQIRVSPERILVTCKPWGWPREIFEFKPDDLTGLQVKHGILPFNVGVVFEHKRSEYPELILFWTFRLKELVRQLRAAGYAVKEQLKS